jgi:predicted dehydrogenase
MFSIGLIGIGRHCRHNHAPALRRLAVESAGELRLAVLCDLNRAAAERGRAEYGFERAAGSFDEMFSRNDLDAVVAILPVPAILATTEELLRRGKPLMIEKPLGSGPAEARRLAEAVRAAGLPVQVSLNRRYDPGLRLALDWAREQGPILSVHGRMLREDRLEPEFLWGTAPHLLDALCHVAGPLELPPGGAAAPPGNTRCNRVGRLQGPSGIAVTFEVLPDCGRVDERITLSGKGFHVDVGIGTTAAWSVEAWRDGALAWSRTAPAGEPEFLRNGAYAEMQAFIADLRAGRPLMPSVADALAATRIAEALDRMTPGFVA